MTAVAPAGGNRVVCYCDDCQAFARFLGRAEEILDEHGGTDVFQTSSGRLRITSGNEQLACIRLSRVGPLRWYTACCKTPVANTLALHLAPFAGLFRFCLDAGGPAVDEALGPIRRRVFCRFARGEVSGPRTHKGVPVAMMLRVAGVILLARLRGDHKRSPFFDQASRQPIAAPRILDDAEVERLHRMGP